jgi:hypothetical protein
MGLATVFYCSRFENSILVASYDSKGYGGLVCDPHLHTGRQSITCPPLITRDEPNRDHHLERFYIISCISVATKHVSISQQHFDLQAYLLRRMYALANRCLAMDYSDFQVSCHNNSFVLQASFLKIGLSEPYSLRTVLMWENNLRNQLFRTITTYCPLYFVGVSKFTVMKEYLTALFWNKSEGLNLAVARTNRK